MRFIVNPAAGGGNVGRCWPKVHDFLREQGLEVNFVLTEGVGHATDLSRQALAEGEKTIVAVGGDGTINEVVNGLVSGSGGQIDPAVSLGIVPLGTGSDLRRTLGIPRDYRAACRLLMSERTRAIDLGEMVWISDGEERRRYFVNFAGLGFDGEVVERVEGESKKLGGTITYLKTVLVTLMNYANKDIRLNLDGEESHMRVNSVIVCNGCHAAGGMYIAPHASPDDGLFDVIVIGDIGKLEFLANVPRVYRGTHLKNRHVSSYRAREVCVETEDRVLVQADGELVGQPPVSFRIMPRALKIRL